MLDMRRRAFVTLLGAASAWSVAARAQQAMPIVGFLNPASPETVAYVVTAFRKGLSEAGFVEGRNVAIEFRWAHHDSDRLPELAADLVRRRVNVIATPQGGVATVAAKAATSTIPIVFEMANDPVQLGLVASFNRPGGNITGIISMSAELGAKKIELLHELLPKARRIGALVNAKNPAAKSVVRDLQAAGAAIGRGIEIAYASTPSEIEFAVASLASMRTDAFLVSTDTLFITRRVQLATLSIHHKLPAIYSDRRYTEAGGLISYGTDLAELYRQTGVYVGRVLNGEKPGDLPVMQPTKFELLINLQTARLFGIEVPATLLARADEVIE
jgi:putative ABC transport system substrate-binding protein